MADTQKNEPAIAYREVEYGFQYGAANVTRLCSDVEKGWVVLRIATPKSTIQVYVTKTGKIRVTDSDGEWVRPSKGETT